MDIDQLFTQFPMVTSIVNTYVNSFELDSNYTTGGDSGKYVFADYKALSASNGGSFRFVLVKGLGHVYPNGKNNPIKGAEVDWKWMKNYRLP